MSVNSKLISGGLSR